MSYGEKTPNEKKPRPPMTAGSWALLVIFVVAISPFIIWAYRWALGLL